MQILVVDDERVVRNALKGLLAGEGYEVRTAAGGARALECLRAEPADLVLLDVMMPDMNGFRVCQEIRRLRPDLPVVFLTARDSDADELRGLGVGADDYLPKTASEQILLARIASALRRAARADRPAAALIPLERAQVDTLRQVLVLDGRETVLTVREVEMLRWFAANRGTVASHDFLLTRFWGADANVSPAALQMQVRRLRDKLGPLGPCLASVHAQGYVFRPLR